MLPSGISGGAGEPNQRGERCQLPGGKQTAMENG